MSRLAEHLIVAPVILPLLASAAMLMLDEQRRNLRIAINCAATFALIAIAVVLLRMADAPPTGDALAYENVYRLGDWPAPVAIVFVLDRLSALMLLLTSILASACLVYSLARWHRAGTYFHPLFQLLLMGLNGAFLTGDLFNLFVFFELLLAASYGLALHGSGAPRVRAGLHYIAINLAASLLFLIGVSLIYGVTGTLNMADLAIRIRDIAPDDRMLLEAGAGILGTAFLVKAGMWPLCFWLPSLYSAATPPVAAIFAVMTKVGAYIVLRLWPLLFGADAGSSASFGGDWLLYGGMMTIVFGTAGMLASQDMARLAAYCVLVSSGTVLAATGLAEAEVTSGVLFYLISSTFALGALYLLAELADRDREPGADVLAVTRELYGEDEDEPEPAGEVGFAIPATMALLALSYMGCALVVAGLPPLSGFIGKFAILTAALNPSGMAAGGTAPVSGGAWALLAVLILSGLAALIAMARAGIRTFWAPLERVVPRVRIIEMTPIIVLLLLCVALTVQAGPVMRYMHDTAKSLHAPQGYIRDVLPPAGAAADRGANRT